MPQGRGYAGLLAAINLRSFRLPVRYFARMLEWDAIEWVTAAVAVPEDFATVLVLSMAGLDISLWLLGKGWLAVAA